MMQVEYLAQSRCLTKTFREALSLSLHSEQEALHCITPSITSHTAHLVQEAGKPGVPLHPPLLNRCHCSCLDLCISRNLALLGEEKGSSLPQAPPRSLLAALQASVEPLHPCPPPSIYRWRNRHSGNQFCGGTESKRLGWDLNSGFHLSGLGGDVQGSVHRGDLEKGPTMAGRPAFSSGLPRALGSARISNLPASALTLCQALNKLDCTSFSPQPDNVTAIFQSKKQAQGVSAVAHEHTEEEAEHLIPRPGT